MGNDDFRMRFAKKEEEEALTALKTFRIEGASEVERVARGKTSVDMGLVDAIADVGCGRRASSGRGIRPQEYKGTAVPSVAAPRPVSAASFGGRRQILQDSLSTT
ncbi:hypothetical protein CPLU01_12313 [Colletotrichum plurivorum]|uniref:Uncharacterized protein n=1 Tax=Colletotrichum plurivorum TaxID=2175906 RepID=A0A8H6JZD6_9PEZI|nr:hypothetical protein CPLU01_12313 [Colletotrichum plurivorum]